MMIISLKISVFFLKPLSLSQWCSGGMCVPMQRPSASLRGSVIDGVWSAWSPYSPCSSDCVARGSSPAVGIMVSTRRCDNPR